MHFVNVAIISAVLASLPVTLEASRERLEVEYRECVNACTEAARESFIPDVVFFDRCMPECLRRIECVEQDERVYLCRDKG